MNTPNNTFTHIIHTAKLKDAETTEDEVFAGTRNGGTAEVYAAETDETGISVVSVIVIDRDDCEWEADELTAEQAVEFILKHG